MTMPRPAAVLVLLFACSLSVAQEQQERGAGARPDRLELDLLLQRENVGDPKLSPDGKQIVYTREWTDAIEDRTRSELWIMDVDGRRQRLLTKGSNAEWSPDGTKIAFNMQVPEKEGFEIELPKAPKGAKWAEEPKVITRLAYRPGNARSVRADGSW